MSSPILLRIRISPLVKRRFRDHNFIIPKALMDLGIVSLSAS